MAEGSGAVFLSYASQDSEAARRICEALRAGGIEVWFDQSELRGGDAWDQKIRKQIRDCALFIPIISSNTRSRHEGYFRLEWDLADQRTHMIARNRAFIVPVCTDDTPDSAADVPESFARVQWTRLPAGQTPATFVERVAGLLEPRSGALAVPLAPPAAPIPEPNAPGAKTTSARGWLLGVCLMATLVLVGGIYIARQGLQPSSRTVAASAVASAPSAIPEQSVAVLPFVNMSSDKEQEYFSDGLTEEMIDLLGRLPDLRVPARTSSFYFKGKNEPIANIAQQLKVAHVLEGSVRKSGKRLRITTQLIRADSGYQLWSETYDREDKDIFAVQDDIARAVVKALQVKLAPGTLVSSSRGTTSSEAYNQYLLAQQSYRHGNYEGYLHAIAAYERAIALEPRYAQAYAGLAISRAFAGDQVGDSVQIERARRDADKAVTLAPDESSAYAARGYIRASWFWDWSGALSDTTKALDLDPHSCDAQRRYASVLDVLGRVPEAIAAERQAVELDPLSPQAWASLGYYYAEMRNYEAADKALERALQIEPKSNSVLTSLGMLRLLQDKAQQSLEVSKAIDEDSFRLMGIAVAEHSLGHAAKSEQALQELVTTAARYGAYQIASIHAWRGENDLAFHWLERAYQQKDGGLSNVRGDPYLNSLHADPRFNALLRKMKLPKLTNGQR